MSLKAVFDSAGFRWLTYILTFVAGMFVGWAGPIVAMGILAAVDSQ